MVSEVELVYRTKIKPLQRPKITDSRSTYDLLIHNWNQDKIELLEEFKLLLLNRGNRVLGLVDISVGGSSGTIADPKIIFTAALKGKASAVILVHNHPSGNIRPSRQDETITHQLKEGGKLLDIIVMDHVIVSSEGYFSFADEGLI